MSKDEKAVAVQGEVIIPKILKSKEKLIKAFPTHTNRASSIGHPCIRALVLKRKSWQDIPMISVRLKLRFELGDLFERKVIRDMDDADIEVFQTQAPFFDEKTNISGHIDGLIRLEDEVFPLEIKSMSPMVFPRINSINDMLNSSYPYMQAYPYQLETYMMLGGYARSVFILIDKSSGAYKEIWFEANLERQEEIREKARVIDAHLKTGTLPDCPEYNDKMCGMCDLVHICKPAKAEGSVTIVADEDLLEALKRREKLSAAFKEYNKVQKFLKGALEGKNGVAGDFLIESNIVKRTGYTVKDSEYYSLKIKPL